MKHEPFVVLPGQDGQVLVHEFAELLVEAVQLKLVYTPGESEGLVETFVPGPDPVDDALLRHGLELEHALECHLGRREAADSATVAAVHHSDPAAGGEPQARLLRPPHDASRSEAVRRCRHER